MQSSGRVGGGAGWLKDGHDLERRLAAIVVIMIDANQNHLSRRHGYHQVSTVGMQIETHNLVVVVVVGRNGPHRQWRSSIIVVVVANIPHLHRPIGQSRRHVRAVQIHARDLVRRIEGGHHLLLRWIVHAQGLVFSGRDNPLLVVTDIRHGRSVTFLGLQGRQSLARGGVPSLGAEFCESCRCRRFGLCLFLPRLAVGLQLFPRRLQTLKIGGGNIIHHQRRRR
mmetsp:Transcript_1947/g.5366  ORF Transcript_1947/g.5366 Transcript_1947/m.5366 type:complete len:224 (+) Transcript_1947:590-1261(+)